MTAEEVAERYDVPRDQQDKIAAASNAKAAAAQASLLALTSHVQGSLPLVSSC